MIHVMHGYPLPFFDNDESAASGVIEEKIKNLDEKLDAIANEETAEPEIMKEAVKEAIEEMAVEEQEKQQKELDRAKLQWIVDDISGLAYAMEEKLDEILSILRPPEKSEDVEVLEVGQSDVISIEEETTPESIPEPAKRKREWV